MVLPAHMSLAPAGGPPPPMTGETNRSQKASTLMSPFAVTHSSRHLGVGSRRKSLSEAASVAHLCACPFVTAVLGPASGGAALGSRSAAILTWYAQVETMVFAV